MRPTLAREAAEADAALGVDLYGVLGADAEDLVFSPASVATALRMALCGASGQTAAELATVLHLGKYPETQNVAAAGLRRIPAPPGTGEPGGSAIFRAPATIWIQSGLRLGGSFQARVVTPGVTLADAHFRAAPAAPR